MQPLFSDASVWLKLIRLAVTELDQLCVYCDKTTKISNTSIVRRLSVRRLLRVYCDKTTEIGFIFILRLN